MSIYSYEDELKDEGYNVILGIDEVGRGAIAGPLVVAGVILPPLFYLEDLNDSKKLTPKKREILAKIIHDQALSVKIIFKSVDFIDKHNIYKATKLTMEQICETIEIKPDLVLVDAMPIVSDYKTLSIIKGDQLSASIAAASIVAKVARDNYMKKMDLKFPGYGFSKHKGYCTKLHQEKLKELGPSLIHRKSFYPVSTYFLKYKQAKIDF